MKYRILGEIIMDEPELEKWIKEGFSEQEYRKWSLQGFTLEEALIWVKCGYSIIENDRDR